MIKRYFKRNKTIRNTDDAFTFKAYAWKQFKSNKPGLISMYILLLFVAIAILSPFIANQQPLYAKYGGKTYFPAFQTLFNETYADSVVNPKTGFKEYVQFDITDWRMLDLESVIWPLIPYSPDQTDRYARDFVGPNDEQKYKSSEGLKESPWILRHHLGTDGIGRDVASGLIHGTKVSLTVGIVSMGIATLIGVLLGAFAGYYGNDRLKLKRGQIYFTYIGLFLGYFYGFVVRGASVQTAFNDGMSSGIFAFLLNLLVFFGFIVLFNKVGKWMPWKGYFAGLKAIKVDGIVSRSIEVLNSLPSLLLIITIAAIMKERSLVVLMIIIGLTSWTGIARFTRAEFLRLREMEFIQAAKVLGFSDFRIIFRHALPNGLAAVFVSVAFGIASAILVESSLSFLGIGVPDEVVTWGSLLSIGRQEFDAWWLVVFPGLAIFITITIYNLIGEALRDALDPKLKK